MPPAPTMRTAIGARDRGGGGGGGGGGEEGVRDRRGIRERSERSETRERTSRVPREIGVARNRHRASTTRRARGACGADAREIF